MMKTIKQNLKKEIIESDDVFEIINNYSKVDKIRIILYCAEDVIHLTDSQQAKFCIELVKDWLKGRNIEEKEFIWAAKAVVFSRYNDNVAIDVADVTSSVAYAAASNDDAVVNSYVCSACCFSSQKHKRQEYIAYARLFAYQDLNFPHRDFAKTFNLDNDTDLNIFLDFLTDHYPTAITYDREEYFKTKLAKEYLKVIYQ